jgi:hypothetical protein
MCEEEYRTKVYTETSTAAQILQESMVDAGQLFLKDLPVLVDVVVDVLVVDNWYEK